LPDRAMTDPVASAVVTAAEMRQIEERLFAAGMPVAALMEKVAGAIAARLPALYPRSQFPGVGILAGPGHNGGDALVVARELHLRGYRVAVCQPLAKLKELPAAHSRYVESLGIPIGDRLDLLLASDWIVDGLFGFGQERPVEGELAALVDRLNDSPQPVVSLDIPSGIHTDTGAVLGTAVRATRSLCLGLWKRAYLQDRALEYLGAAERVDFGIQPDDIWAMLSRPIPVRQMTAAIARELLPLPRPRHTHKYRQGFLLAIAGSSQYAGAAHLVGLGARASGVGMLALCVPESIKAGLTLQMPDALAITCPETASGGMAALPEELDWQRYSAIACGPGLTLAAAPVVKTALASDLPLVLDADGLNVLAHLGVEQVRSRRAPTILTPHAGEFARLFPDLPDPTEDRIEAVKAAAASCGAVVLLKGAKTAIAHPNGTVWLIAESTPALARGGSGDVLTGLLGGLLAQPVAGSAEAIAALAAWWHARAGLQAASERGELGVDACTLTQYLPTALGGDRLSL